MIDIQIDGIWCSKCKTFHPTLYWHQKYNIWLLSRKNRHPEVCKRFGINTHYLDGIDVVECEDSECVVCGEFTNYADRLTGCPVCSDECKYNNRNI